MRLLKEKKELQMINPNEVDLLKDFLHYLEDSGMLIIEDELFTSSKSWYNKKPKRGDTAHMSITYNSKFPSDKEIDDRIELFLKNRND